MAILKKIFYKIIYGNHIKFGKKVTFRKGFSLIIEDNATVKIGNGTFFNNYCSIIARENISIGDNCLFGENVKIYDHNHRFNIKDKLIKEQGFNTGKIKIGNNVWVGSNVIILKNVSIGDNSVVGAGIKISDNIEKENIYINEGSEKIRYEQ